MSGLPQTYELKAMSAAPPLQTTVDASGGQIGPTQDATLLAGGGSVPTSQEYAQATAVQQPMADSTKIAIVLGAVALFFFLWK